MNELTIRTQEGIMDFAKDYIKNNRIITSRTYDLPTAMSSLYLNLIEVKDKNNKPAIETCRPETIQEAVMQCVNEELNISKKQGYFIPYGDKLVFQKSYFGNVKRAKDLANVRIVSNVVRDGEQVDLETRIDGTIIIHHKPSIKCLGNPIIAVYAVATDIETGRVDNSDIMSVKEAKASWLKSKNGGSVGKEFEHEMLRRTVENRLAKHYINKSDDSQKIYITDVYGNDVQVNSYEELPPIDVEYTIDTDEQITKEKTKYIPTEDHVVTADDLKLEPIAVEPSTLPEGAVEVLYSEYKNNKEKYELVKDTYNSKTRTCFVVPVVQNN